MKKQKYKFRRGISLVDTIAATAVLMVIVTGTLFYRYYATLDIVKSRNHLDAVEMTVALLHAWQGVNGDESFDPVTDLYPQMNISSGSSQNQPDGYNLLGKYDISKEQTVYHLTMSYKDIEDSIRQLNIQTSWSQNDTDNQKTLKLTSYAN